MEDQPENPPSPPKPKSPLQGLIDTLAQGAMADEEDRRAIRIMIGVAGYLTKALAEAQAKADHEDADLMFNSEHAGVVKLAEYLPKLEMQVMALITTLQNDEVTKEVKADLGWK